jgi:osmoprotectant transport system permease protein
VVDRVVFVGALLALAGCLLLPFVEFRANRIVDGQQLALWNAAGPWAWALIAACCLEIAAAFVPRDRRPLAALIAAAVTFTTLVFAVGHAALTLTPGGTGSPARVSIGAGAWLVLAGTLMVWFQGSRGSSARARAGALALAAGALLAGMMWGGLGRLSLVLEYQAQSDTFWTLTLNHVGLTVGGTAIAALIGLPLGVAAARSRLVRSTAIPAAGIIQTVPSLALFGLLIVPLAALGLPTIGTVPALIALTLYALLPIVRNTYLGVAGVDSAIVDAGRGMGMSRAELLWRVEGPLALPLMLEGLRAALVLTVGIAAVMAIGGAQDLGTLVFYGWGVQAPDLVLLGALPMVVLAIIADQGMRALERSVVSPGIREQREAA